MFIFLNILVGVYYVCGEFMMFKVFRSGEIKTIASNFAFSRLFA